MTLVKTTPTPVRAFAVAKASVSGPTGKSPPTMKKAVDVTSSLKKPPAPSSPIKGKPMSAPMKPTTKPEPSVVKVEKSTIKMEKSPLKLTVTKASISSTIKSPPATNKSPVSKSPAKETKTQIRNVAKPIITPRTPEQKQLDSKKDISTVRSSEKLDSKTIANSVSVSKSPIKSNTLSSPVKSISSPTRSISSPAKSISSPVKSVSSPVKSVSPSATSVKSISSPTKSVSSPTKLTSSATKSISSPVKPMSPPGTLGSSRISSPVKSRSPPATLVSSPTRSISSPVKSASSPTKSISSPIKSILSPIKPKITREVNLSSPGKPKDTKVTLLSPSSSMKKPLNLLKSPIKPTQSSTGKMDVTGKLKPSLKSSPTSKVVKNNTITTKTTVKKQPTVAAIDEVSNISDCAVEKLDLCHSDETLEIGETSSNGTGIITEYTIDNTSNFDVVQAFKVAEQLIKIQSNDRNLETIIETCENTSGINWDDVITPCDDFAVSNPNDKTEPPSLVRNDLAVSSLLSAEESSSNCDSCIIEMANSNYTADSQLLDGKQDDQSDKLVISTNCDENNNNVTKLIDIVVPSSTSSQFSEIELNDEKYFTNELPSKTSDNDSIPDHNDETESAEIESDDEDNSSNCADDSIEHHCDENVLPEWTITIDEFSLDLSGKEIQSSEVAEKENYTVDEIPCIVGLSYADILKKSPNVLANSTNLEVPRKEPKLNDDTLIKSYQSPKKGKSSCPKDMHFDDTENNYQNCDDLYDVPEYCDMRKKKHKKIKHLSRRHLRNININRECEYIESQSDIFVTHVWKDIF